MQSLRDTKVLLADASPRAVSTLLEFREIHGPTTWNTGELQAMLRHQLAAPLCLSLGVLSGEVAHQLHETTPRLDPLLTLGQLLAHPQPPLALLVLVKRFAKICRSDPDNPLPGELVMLMYYASIAIAQVRMRQPISELPTAELRRGLRWIAAQAWMEPTMRELLVDAMEHLE